MDAPPLPPDLGPDREKRRILAIPPSARERAEDEWPLYRQHHSAVWLWSAIPHFSTASSTGWPHPSDPLIDLGVVGRPRRRDDGAAAGSAAVRPAS
jgi:hypothetical protein